jgi:hypothetical protein
MVRVQQVKAIDYEFECEALADYQYKTAPLDLTSDQFDLEQLKPAQFTSGKAMYAQVRDP